MPIKDNLDLSTKNRLDALVDYRRVLVSAVIVCSVILALFVPSMQRDPSLKSGIDATSQVYKQFEKFIEVFGSEEFILVAIKSESGARDPRILSCLDLMARKISESDKVAEVVTLTTLRIFQERGARYGNYPIAEVAQGEAKLPEAKDLEEIRKALPVTDYLVSPDLKTVGVLIRIKDEWKFEPKAIKPLVAEIEKLVTENTPPGTEFKLVGPALIRQAIVKYSVETAWIFGALCMLIGTVVSVYIFKSLKVTAITNLILGICILWVLGLVAVCGIPVNSTTALSFGFIPITTLEIVIHMVVRYHQFHELTRNKIGAIKKTVRWLARPCLICSATTAVGFGSLMIGSIPMVRQLGFIMGFGIMIAYCLQFILTPAFFTAMKSLDAPDYSSMLRDWLEKVLRRIETSIFSHHKYYVAFGVALTVVLFAGAPLIRSDIQVLRMLSESTPEVKNIEFVEANLIPVSSVELVIEAEPGTFKSPDVWQKVVEVDKRLKAMPEVVSTDSLLPLLGYLNRLVDAESRSYEDLFTKPGRIPQLLVMTSLSADGRRVARRFVTEDLDRLRISVRIKNSASVPIGKTIEDIRHAADSVMNGTARVVVTGDLAVFDGQTSELIADQIKSICIAAVLITILMMFQMGSPMLGLISLIPNIPPIAAVFGIMGWFGISLDGVTVFAATVAVGLAVDNTIHYLTQLKREIRISPEASIEESVRRAYRLTAKQIASYASVTILGFLALSVSPFRPVVLFGVLGFSAVFLGLFCDLIFIQSLILSSKTIRNTIRKLINREIAAESGAR